MPRDAQITRLLNDAVRGDKGAESDLFDLIYTELRDIARKEMLRWPAGQTSQPTALVNQMYLRIFSGKRREWPSRRYFFKAAARAIHELMIEDHRRKQKRGYRQPMPSDLVDRRAHRGEALDFLALKDALSELDQFDPRAAEVFRHRFLNGLSVKLIAELLTVSPSTVWQKLAPRSRPLSRFCAKVSMTGANFSSQVP